MRLRKRAFGWGVLVALLSATTPAVASDAAAGAAGPCAALADAIGARVAPAEIDDVEFELAESTVGADVDYRLYGPGANQSGSLKFTSAVTLGPSKELQTLFPAAAKGKNIRKNITVNLFKSEAERVPLDICDL